MSKLIPELHAYPEGERLPAGTLKPTEKIIEKFGEVMHQSPGQIKRAERKRHAAALQENRELRSEVSRIAELSRTFVTRAERLERELEAVHSELRRARRWFSSRSLRQRLALALFPPKVDDWGRS